MISLSFNYSRNNLFLKNCMAPSFGFESDLNMLPFSSVIFPSTQGIVARVTFWIRQIRMKKLEYKHNWSTMTVNWSSAATNRGREEQEIQSKLFVHIFSFPVIALQTIPNKGRYRFWNKNSHFSCTWPATVAYKKALRGRNDLVHVSILKIWCCKLRHHETKIAAQFQRMWT
jgi:hypothetical protein